MKVYKKLFSYAGDKKSMAILAILLSALSVLATILGYYYIYLFLSKLIIEKNLGTAQIIAIKTSVFLTLGGVLYMVSVLFSHILGFRLETNLRKKGIDGLEKSSFRFFDLNPSGKIRKVIDDNAAQTHQVVAHMIPDSSQAILTPILAIGLGFFISIRVGIVLLTLAILGGLILGSMMGGGEFMEYYQKSLEILSGETVEYVRGMQVVKVFGATVESFKTLYKAIKDYSKYAYSYSLSCKKPYVIYQWLFFGIISILIIPVVFFIEKLGSPESALLDLIMILFLTGVLFVSFMRIMWFSQYIFKGNYAVDTLENVYEEMQKDKLTHGDKDSFKNYNIEFDGVSFAYNENLVLDNLSFKLEEGKSYALVGSSGSGKSTIAKLISGFYKVDKGRIKIGEEAIENYSSESLIHAISFVFQNSKLFNMSIYDNVALANKKANREEVMKALELAGCRVILDKFPERENTVIGSKGVFLSGGETQRIAIARAILKDAKIIIMDEASASIDPDNEYELQKAFQNLIKGKTVIMIAHRLSSIRAVDEIIVLNEGKIIERGSDEELMSFDSSYKKLQDLYQSANDWRVGNEEFL
ncbi:ABC transporter ATP-binding protein/permease [Streptococcus anginosus]|uniref:ABC transporter ATP-binding protein n=1 Tax=Streptococcus anginosus TaxID=1328 RepID=UPI0021F86239|nr:ABC transporter ATP-binding protein [Streptococcus anginosus]MCW1010649.1 ABC transporter ATP-binding protein/permease [Streptococcus anginosus]